MALFEIAFGEIKVPIKRTSPVMNELIFFCSLINFSGKPGKIFSFVV